MKCCTKCNIFQSVDQFQKGHNRCKTCARSYMRTWVNNNRDKINDNQRNYQATIHGRASVLLNAALKRAISKNERFDLTHDDVKFGISSGLCQKTLLRFDFSLRRNGDYQINPLAPSIDKIDPSGIYTPSNVQYVCAWYNLAKGQMTDIQLIQFCKQVVVIHG